VNEYAQQVLDDIQSRVAGIPDSERVQAMFLFQYDDTVMITSGKNFFGQYWIDCAGGVNVAEGLSEVGSNAVISMEQVYEWNPEIIYITNFTPTLPADIYGNAVRGDDWSSVAAVQGARVYKMPLGAYRSYTPGVDTPLTLLFMAKTMYPDLFADVDLTAEVKGYYLEFFGITLTDDDVQAMYNPSADAGVAGFMNK
jgi:iron complex transport system substrate-binding protein